MFPNCTKCFVIDSRKVERRPGNPMLISSENGSYAPGRSSINIIN